MSSSTPTRTAGATFWLPNENEWIKAAYFDPATATYTSSPTKIDGVPTAAQPNSTNSNSANYNSVISQSGIPSGTLRLTPVGGYQVATSFYGTYDQAGNANEWTETSVSSSRRVRGGSWLGASTQMTVNSIVNLNPTTEQDTVGFRIASAVPEPSSALLVLMTGAALLLKKRKRG